MQKNKSLRVISLLLSGVLLAAALPLGALAEQESRIVLRDAAGSLTVCGYDAENDRLLWSRLPGQTERTEYSYDGEGNLIEAKKPVEGLSGGLDEMGSRFVYEGGVLTQAAYPNTVKSETAYSFAYNDDRELIEVRVGEHLLVKYDADGIAYGNGSAVRIVREEAGQVSRVLWEDGTEACYTWDTAGRLSSVSCGGLYREYRWTESGAPLSLMENRNGQTRQIRWRYNAKGRCIGRTEQTGQQLHKEIYSYNLRGQLSRLNLDGRSIRLQYDADGRLTQETVLTGTGQAIEHSVIYAPAEEGITGRVARWEARTAAGEGCLRSYTYDAVGRIQSVTDEAGLIRYTYDGAGQLVREDNAAAGQSWTYHYDANGNRTAKNTYPYSTGTLGTALEKQVNTYGVGGWGDLCKTRAGLRLESDGIGNLLQDGRRSYRWAKGRQLVEMTDADGRSLSFDYDADGLRTAKQTPDGDWQYNYTGALLTGLSCGEETMQIRWGSLGPVTLTYQGTEYYYLRNMQGDVVALADAEGHLVVRYAYDGWGRPLSVGGELADTLGRANPLRYRSYVYDEETGLYYLGSRYYDPAEGRFLCADFGLSASGVLLGGNLFLYGLNDPVDTVDPDGAWPRFITRDLSVLMAALSVTTTSYFALKLTVITSAVYAIQTVHFSLREKLNVDLPDSLEEAIRAGWIGPGGAGKAVSAALHQHSAEVFGDNIKFVSPDGYREVIYNKWGEIVQDVRDIGTYNFSPSGSLRGTLGHLVLDVIPWAVFGNGDEDPGLVFPLVGGTIRGFWAIFRQIPSVLRS